MTKNTVFRLLEIPLHNIVRYPMVWEKAIFLLRYVLDWCSRNRLNDERIFCYYLCSI